MRKPVSVPIMNRLASPPVPGTLHPVVVGPGVGISTGPGNSTGTLTAGSDVTINGTYVFEINGSSADKLVVDGALDISNAAIDFNTLGGGITLQVYIIATYGSLTGTAFANVIDLPSGFYLSYNYYNFFYNFFCFINNWSRFLRCFYC